MRLIVPAAVSVLCSLTASCGDGTGPAAPAGQIAFASNRSGDWELYLMSADGTGMTRLTTRSGQDLEPTWSPDGQRIAFIRDLHDDQSSRLIFVMNADGSDARQVTTLGVRDSMPSWSPDGQSIVFSRGNFPFSADIHTIAPDGTGLVRLTNDGLSTAPSWSPDGSSILYQRNNDIYVMDADGGNQRLLSAGFNWSPAWSSDGGTIAFSGSHDGHRDIFVMSPDGTGARPLVSRPSVGDFEPAWSPDGRFLAFVSYTGNVPGGWYSYAPSDIFIVRADGSGVTQLTHDESGDIRPVWRP